MLHRRDRVLHARVPWNIEPQWREDIEILRFVTRRAFKPRQLRDHVTLARETRAYIVERVVRGWVGWRERADALMDEEVGGEKG